MSLTRLALVSCFALQFACGSATAPAGTPAPAPDAKADEAAAPLHCRVDGVDVPVVSSGYVVTLDATGTKTLTLYASALDTTCPVAMQASGSLGAPMCLIAFRAPEQSHVETGTYPVLPPPAAAPLTPAFGTAWVRAGDAEAAPVDASAATGGSLVVVEGLSHAQSPLTVRLTGVTLPGDSAVGGTLSARFCGRR